MAGNKIKMRAVFGRIDLFGRKLIFGIDLDVLDFKCLIGEIGIRDSKGITNFDLSKVVKNSGSIIPFIVTCNDGAASLAGEGTMLKPGSPVGFGGDDLKFVGTKADAVDVSG